MLIFAAPPGICDAMSAMRKVIDQASDGASVSSKVIIIQDQDTHSVFGSCDYWWRESA